MFSEVYGVVRLMYKRFCL